MSTDPWLEAANNLQSRLASENAARQQARAAEEARGRQKHLEWQRKDAVRRVAIAAEATKLATLLASRGPAAQTIEYAVLYGGRQPQEVTDWFVDTLNRLAKLANA